MLCPMIKIECLKKDCAWYVEKYEECALKAFGESLANIEVCAEDSGIKVITNDGY